MFSKSLLQVLLVSSLCLTSLAGVESQKKEGSRIKLYACYTPSHEVLVKDWFLPSIKDDYEVMIERHEQACPTACYMSNGWTNATLKKVEMIVRAVEANWGGVFVYSDVDIQFFKPTKDLLLDAIQGIDIVIQRDNPDGTICTGFFMCRANEKTLAVWQEVKRRLSDSSYLKKHPKIDDQTEFNKIVEEKKLPLVWDYLPAKFLSGGTLTGKGWDVGRELVIPKNIVLHHANWTPSGVNLKIEELKYVKKVVTSWS